jgi:uncharacterized protein
MHHPLLLALLVGASIYLARVWQLDLRAANSGQPNPNAFPGTATAPARTYILAITGALVLLTIETIGEIKLGLDAQQTRMTGLFAVYTVLSAPLIEELIFRGWLVVESTNRVIMWAAAAAASIVFAFLHPFLWRWDDAGFVLTFGRKEWFSTAIVFAMSLGLYIVRLAPWNPKRSLFPCIAAHAAKNAGVVAIKAAMGFIAGWW